VAMSVLLCIGCNYSENAMDKDSAINSKDSVKEHRFNETDACKALVRDLRISAESALGKALLAGQFTRSGNKEDCIVEAGQERLFFNVKERKVTIVKGGGAHEIWAEFYVSEAGELKARFTGGPR